MKNKVDVELYTRLSKDVAFMHDYINNLWGAAICLDEADDIINLVEEVERMLSDVIRPTVRQIKSQESEGSVWSPAVSNHAVKDNRLPKQRYSNFDLRKEGKPMKDNTYTISYKQCVDDDWVLVTKTGRSDSTEARDIMMDLVKDEIPESHLEMLMNTFEVNQQLTKLIAEGKGGNSIE